ncbi:hypothetical protein [Rhodopseudomonas sp. B29]|uniref:hypothetical protein n=1 Tax=Rhodopseudomonas sp. B29 TaxID=95607 RepID=UPI00034595B6|nr:hypothetical protein [Rhodopseudomonas sp. B29]
MSTSRTASDLVYEVAGLLGILEAGEALGPVEFDTIDKAIDPVLEEVSDIAYIGDRDDIPNRYFQTLARLVTVHAAAKFSNATPDMQAIRTHEQRLRELAAQATSADVVQFEDF